jgi:hypothetical protein
MAKKHKIDFGETPKEIRRGGGSKHIPEGDYLVKIVSADLKSTDEGTKYFAWKFQVAKGDEKGAPLYNNTSLQPHALFGLRNLIHAVTGKNVAGKAVNFDPETLYGKVIAVTVEDEEYKDKMRSRIVDMRPKEELNIDGDEDDDDEEEEEEEEDEELDEVEVEDL